MPDQPKSVYRRVVRYLLEDWDASRSVRRPSLYSNFETDRKSDFLAHLAFELTACVPSARFSVYDLRACYDKIHIAHKLPKDEMEKVLREIESHTGIIIESGSDYFEFAHLSLQEFLGADHIIRLPDLSLVLDHVNRLPNQMAIAVALSSSPSEYLVKLILGSLRDKSLDSNWYNTFAYRLVLERPALSVAPSALGVVSIFSILSKISDPLDFLNRFGGILPEKSAKQLFEYYSMPRHMGGKSIFSRLKSNPLYKLPMKIEVDEAAYRLFS